LQEEALDRALWKIRCGSDYGPVVRQATVCWICCVLYNDAMA